MDKSEIYAKVISSAMQIIYLKQQLAHHEGVIKRSLSYSEFKDGEITNSWAKEAFKKSSISICEADYVGSTATIEGLIFPVSLHEKIGENGRDSMIRILAEAKIK